MSDGNSASKSSTRTIPPIFSRNTISSPRRKISTSELLTRNFFGSLTAWLFPDLNTRAMAMICLSYIYINVYTLASSNSRAPGRAEVEAKAAGLAILFEWCHCRIGKTTVWGCAAPMLDSRSAFNYISLANEARGFPPFLIVASAFDDQQNLAARITMPIQLCTSLIDFSSCTPKFNLLYTEPYGSV